MNSSPSPRNFFSWFDPRHHGLGKLGFILNRITALGLVLYLFMHLVVLGKLAQGPQAYDQFVALAKTPLVKIGELLVIAGGVIHGLNGIRVGMTGMGVGVRAQKPLFITLMLAAGLGIAYFAYRMFIME